MDKAEQAKVVFVKSIDEAIGYLDLARMNRENGMDDSAMRQQAIKALQRFSNDDDLVDAFYDEDIKQMELEHRWME